MSYLSDIFLGRKVDYTTQWAPSRVLKKLNAMTSSGGWFKLRDHSKPFEGSVKDAKLRLRKVLHQKSNVIPVFKAEVCEDTNGSRIEGRIRLPLSILILFSLWGGIVIAVAVVFVYFTRMDEAIDAVMLIPLAIIFVVLWAFFLMARYEVKQLDEDLDSFFANLNIEESVQ